MKNDTPQSSSSQKARLNKVNSIADLRNLAQQRLPKAVFDFYDGGAEDECTLRANIDAYKKHILIPQYLVDVSDVQTSRDILGRNTSLPIAISPTGGIGFGWRYGDIAIARAAGLAGVPYTLPTSATASIERVAKAAPDTRLWFQAYMLRKRSFTEGLIERALKAGYEALVITVDMPTGGKRERDFKNDFGLPFRYTPKNLLDFAKKPAWALGMAINGVPVIENMIGFTPDAESAAQIATSVGKNYDPSFDWKAFAEIRRKWPRKLLIKGILHPEDAKRAVQHGCDGIIVSNHGGRQLDGAIASLDALPDIVSEVGSQVEVLLDGGIRRGSDVIKALSLGAHAVMFGRPVLYGVCAAGEEGASKAISIICEEMIRTMKLMGVATIDALPLKSNP